MFDCAPADDEGLDCDVEVSAEGGVNVTRDDGGGLDVIGEVTSVVKDEDGFRVGEPDAVRIPSNEDDCECVGALLVSTRIPLAVVAWVLGSVIVPCPMPPIGCDSEDVITATLHNR